MFSAQIPCYQLITLGKSLKKIRTNVVPMIKPWGWDARINVKVLIRVARLSLHEKDRQKSRKSIKIPSATSRLRLGYKYFVNELE